MDAAFEELRGGHGLLRELPGVRVWQQWARSLLELYEPKERAEIAKSMAGVIRMHQKKTRRPIHETEDDVMSGLSWRYICQMISRGDLKGRKKGQLTQRAIAAAARKGLTFEQVKALEVKR